MSGDNSAPAAATVYRSAQLVYPQYIEGPRVYMAKYVPYMYNKIPITRFCYIKIIFVSFLLFLGLKISYITARTPLNMEVRCYTCAGSTKPVGDGKNSASKIS